MRPAQLTSVTQEVAMVTSVFMAQFLTQGGVTMLLSPMKVVLDSFADRSGDAIESSIKVWFMGSFALTVGTFILISGRIGDLFGLKQTFIAGWIWVALWSLLCGLSVFSNSIIFFIVCRAFQGVGFALILPCGLGLLGFMYPLGQRKNFVFGLVGAAGPTGAVVGALMSAVLAQLAWWPWAYWILCIVSAIMCGIAWIYVPNLNKQRTIEEAGSLLKKRNFDRVRQFDFLGAIVGVTGLVLLNFCWNQGSAANWSAYIIVLLVISVIALVAFFWLELKYVAHPLLHSSVFNRKIGLVLICISLGWGSFGIWQYYFFTIMLNFKHYTPIKTGVAFLPFLVLGCIAAMVCSTLISRTRPSYIICFACIAFLCGDIMLSVTPVDQSYFRVLFGQMFILAWGMDLSFPAASIILSDYLPPHQQGMAGSLVATVVNYSVSLALAMGSVVEFEVNKRTGDELHAIRLALHFGIALAGAGVCFLLVFVYIQKKNDDRGTLMVSANDLEKAGGSSGDLSHLSSSNTEVQ